MRTQVIFLEPQDNISSIRDKMQWARTPRLLLVFPDSNKIHLGDLEFRLLLRHANALGVSVGFVTTAAKIRRNAHFHKIPVFSNADEAQHSVWTDRIGRQPVAIPKKRSDLRSLRTGLVRYNKSWKTTLPARIFFFSLAVIAILSIIFCLYPSAIITFEPAREIQSVEIDYFASVDYDRTTHLGELPAYSNTYYVSASRTIEVTNQSLIPAEYAEGIVTFTNLGVSVVGIPAGTVVRTVSDPIVKYITITDGVLAAQPGKTIDIPVRALEAGTRGNLPPSSLIVIEGDLGGSLSVINNAHTLGGTDKMGFMPSDQDRERLRREIMSDLTEMIVQQATEDLEFGSVVFPDTIERTPDLTETFSPVPGQPGNTLSLNISGEFEVSYSLGTDIRQIANIILNASIKPGYVPEPDTMVMVLVDQPVTSVNGISKWRAEFQRMVFTPPDRSSVGYLVRGEPLNNAIDILASTYKLDSAPRISITPTFWPWLPFSVLRIDITVE